MIKALCSVFLCSKSQYNTHHSNYIWCQHVLSSVINMQKFAEHANLVYLMFGYIEKTNTSDKKIEKENCIWWLHTFHYKNNINNKSEGWTQAYPSFRGGNWRQWRCTYMRPRHRHQCLILPDKAFAGCLTNRMMI